MSTTTIRQSVRMATAALACAAAGWLLGQSGWGSVSVAGTVLDKQGAPAPHTLLASGPTIAVTKDGRVTLHVDNESLQWVLAEIDRQAGGPVAAAAGGVPMDADHGTEVRAAAIAPQSDDVAARLMRGTETERFQTLLQAQNGGAVTEEMLKTLYQTDASPRVRLQAFEAAQEGTEADPAARRDELEAARLLPDAVVAQEAGRRLEDMDRQARDNASQGSTPR
jgi:hypothetical protein